MLREGIKQGIFYSFFLILAFGNLLRFNGFLFTEAFLYLFCFLSFSFSRNFILFSLVVALSFGWGCLQQGFDAEAALYALRLIAFVYAGIRVGELSYERFQGHATPFFSWLLKAYVVALLCSFLIYLLFPESDVLWASLEQYGVVFEGDPHVERFVSVYFDPNFYAAIGCIPFMLSCFLFSKTQKLYYFFFACLFTISIFLTKSRSGIVLFDLLLFYMAWLFFKRQHSLIQSRGRYLLILISSIFVALFIWGQGLLSTVTERLSSIPHDPSAGFRFQSLQNGMEALMERPLFGAGYQFLSKTDLWVDSSLLLFALNFGLCITIGLLIYALIVLFNFYKRSNRSGFAHMLIFYISASVLFFSVFNHLVCYPFWALPVLAIYQFLTRREEHAAVYRC